MFLGDLLLERDPGAAERCYRRYLATEARKMRNHAQTKLKRALRAQKGS